MARDPEVVPNDVYSSSWSDSSAICLFSDIQKNDDGHDEWEQVDESVGEQGEDTIDKWWYGWWMSEHKEMTFDFKNRLTYCVQFW